MGSLLDSLAARKAVLVVLAALCLLLLLSHTAPSSVFGTNRLLSTDQRVQRGHEIYNASIIKRNAFACL
jgi:hypothetical protein